ncbi:MAG: 30S ribosomal protein S17 [Candidatus Aenigmarchaeota archaeon]|nr:30S ribosomal protein S17 [Candidatus Aenigmarchaeota archaeon]
MDKESKKDIGIGVSAPKGKCSDGKCPWHGHLKVRGRIFRGEVVSNRAQKTAIVKWHYYNYVPKYERYERRNTKVAAYNPECLSASIGDTVTIAECRPLSKTKKFVVVDKK